VIRRRRPHALALAVLLPLAAATVSSCATFTDNANAARVGDVELPRADLEQYVHDALEARDSAEVPDDFPGEVNRSILGAWIIDEMVRQYLAEVGAQITDGDRRQATAQFDEQLGGTEVSDFLRNYEIESRATRAAFTRVAPDEGALLAFAEEADVYVDPVYGYWNLEVASVLPMG
jgi:hypothetical protein